jgi:hypothetical protein
MPTQSAKTMEHFLKLARRGKPDTGASGGELRARRLALAISENAVGLDAQAIEGAAEFLRRAPLAISTARDFIDAEIDHP